MRFGRILLTAAMAAGLALGAAAAPFCVDVTGLPRQCLFVDPGLCQKEAARQGGQCVANADEVATPPRAQSFCLVLAGNVMSCIYPDRADCDADGRRLRGACIPALPTPPLVPAPAPGVDPYQVTRPY